MVTWITGPHTRRVSRINVAEAAADRLRMEEGSYDPGNRRYNLRKRATMPENRESESIRLTEASQERLFAAIARNTLWMQVRKAEIDPLLVKLSSNDSFVLRWCNGKRDG